MEPTCKGQLAGECAVADADQEEATWDPVEIPTCSDITETLEQVTHQENCEISEGRARRCQAQETTEATPWSMSWTQADVPPFAFLHPFGVLGLGSISG